MFFSRERYPISDPSVSYDGMGYGAARDQMLVLKFDKYQTYYDSTQTIGCVAIACSNLFVATYTHMQELTHWSKYLDKLDRFWGRERPSFGLVGGDDGSTDMATLDKFENQLKKRGYSLAGRLVGGRGYLRTLEITPKELVVVQSKSGIADEKYTISFG